MTKHAYVLFSRLSFERFLNSEILFPTVCCCCHLTVLLSVIKSHFFTTPAALRSFRRALSALRLQVSSPHLARSYHHLFPVLPFEEVTAAAAAAAAAEKQAANPLYRSANGNGAGSSRVSPGRAGGTTPLHGRVSPVPGAAAAVARAACAGCLRDLTRLARYRCPECTESFCLDCDMYIHDSLHNCPGCC